ncbi:MAG: DUF1743 domain-containing protein [Candidatus Bathyarchaeota archaeon]|nr:MAG: DUF1743 domain-containing protein [Candidatus Bathyarchaeota archaeon]
MATLHIGFDDTDSPRGGCTTYIAAILVEKLLKIGITFKDYPNLIRLNPNVPWKTRGNGALCLRIVHEEDEADTIIDTVTDTVEEHSDLSCRNTDPGVVFFQNARIPRKIRIFAKRTIQSVVNMEEALRLIKKFNAEAFGLGSGYGIVGALAAIGETLIGDHTFEVIAYRTKTRRNTLRQIDANSVKEMDQKTSPNTFNNIDPETRRILITPRGPDPILYGIRGETAEVVIQAHKMIQTLEPVERWVVFRTNHGTDAHLHEIQKISEIKPYHPVIATGTVASQPKIVPRRHRIFSLADETGKVDCAAYEPTGTLRKVVRQLIVGDCVEVHGGAKPRSTRTPLTINLEKLRILSLAPKLKFRNPVCLECGKRMNSMGTDQGFRCSKCNYRSIKAQKTMIKEKRVLNQGLFITSPRSQRHLTKPFSRYGKEKAGKPAKILPQWHCP